MSAAQDRALEILMFHALKQTYVKKQISQELADLLSAVARGDGEAIEATITELGPGYAAACSDGEGQS